MPLTHIRSFNSKTPQMGQNVMVDPTAVIIGNVTLADDVSVWPQAVIRGDVNIITIGARTNIQDGCVLHVNQPHTGNDGRLIIGEEVTVGHCAVLHGCQIGNRTLIGMGTIVLDGAVIEDNVIIGVGSVITSNKRLSSGYLYLGSPAKPVRRLTVEESESLKRSAEDYVMLKNTYLKRVNY